MEKIRLFEMFSGYGGARFALKKAGIPFECVGYSEIDKFAIQCYEQNHQGVNFGDCTKIDPTQLPDFDLLTGGFPCQSFSVAGKGLGEADTRGTLFHEIIRIAEVKQPKYMLLENVKGLTNKKHKDTFDKILSELSRIGYFVDWCVLNSKNYGIPQNRERVFFVCKKKEGKFEDWNFVWPGQEELKIFLKDILEDEVDEKYYLSDKQLAKLKEYVGKKNRINADIINCIGTCFGRSGSSKKELESFARTNQALMIGNLSRYKMKSERTMSFKDEGISWALTGNCDVGVMQPKRLFGIFDKDNSIHQAGSVFDKNFISPALDTMQGVWRQPSIIDTNNFLRKLTPKECFRLMGFLDDNINLEGLSNTQRYKLAGNGWDINLVSKIFKELFKK